MKDNGPVFIDSNILVYSVYGSPVQRGKLASLLKNQTLIPVISTQVMKEFVNVSFKKSFHNTTEELIRHLKNVEQSFIVADVTTEIIIDSIDLKNQYRYSFYDSLIIATALKQKCDIIYSEDLQDGQVIRKTLKIVNPLK
jgi:predicted nucleic acid-binding protein